MKRLYFLLITALLYTGALAQLPKHEVRAVWLTTIGGIDWPTSHHAATQKKELQQILDQLKSAGINTVLLQTRVRGTVIYPSDMEPWDACITGTPGRDPGYDPLQFAIDECHRRGMELHAWVVTIPVGKWNKAGCAALRKKQPKLIRKIGDDGFMNPEMPQTADYLAKICSEITSRYDVDGIHLDYIRYPETWRIKVPREQGRKNITRIVEAINYAVKRQKPWVKLSCSPIGKYDDLLRYRSGGWNARTAVCQDAQAWMRRGLMDALYPMMYFRNNQFFPFAIDWQEQSYGRMIVPGLGIYFLDPHEGNWTLADVQRQMNVARSLGLGHCYFRSRFFTDNTKGILDFARSFDATPALIPPMTWAGKQPPSAPATLTLDGHTLSWSGAKDNSGGPYLLYNIYASREHPVDTEDPRNLVAMRVVSNTLSVPATPKMHYAVTAVDRYGQESRPCQLQGGDEDWRFWLTDDIIRSDGNTLTLPHKPSVLDAEYIFIETLQGRRIGTYLYNVKTLDVSPLPEGMFVLRSLSKKGNTHRIGFFCIRRQHRR